LVDDAAAFALWRRSVAHSKAKRAARMAFARCVRARRVGDEIIDRRVVGVGRTTLGRRGS
jgi:hypothetical protein